MGIKLFAVHELTSPSRRNAIGMSIACAGHDMAWMHFHVPVPLPCLYLTMYGVLLVVYIISRSPSPWSPQIITQ
jgi:hypothetical protein